MARQLVFHGAAALVIASGVMRADGAEPDPRVDDVLTAPSGAMPNPGAMPAAGPALLQTVAGLGIAPARRSLRRILLRETVEHSDMTSIASRDVRIEALSDPGTFTLRTQAAKPGEANFAEGTSVSFLGLFDLSRLIGYAPHPPYQSSTGTVLTHLEFRGDWQHLAVGSRVGWRIQEHRVFGFVNSEAGSEAAVCGVSDAGAARQFHPDLEGGARWLSCRLKSTTRGKVIASFVYLVDYGYAVLQRENMPSQPLEANYRILSVEQE